MNNTCPFCKSQPFSLADRAYLRIFGHCWDCDKKAWDNGTLSLEEFERRENIAAEQGVIDFNNK